jgi:hypothetical protein
VRGVQFFLASPNLQNFSVPDGVNFILVELWGAGGGGGHASLGAGAGGGGGGAYRRAAVPVTPGQLLHLSVGGGGAGAGPSSPPNGAAGQPTTLFNDTNSYFVQASGGGGGAGGFNGGGGGSGGACNGSDVFWETGGTTYVCFPGIGGGSSTLISGGSGGRAFNGSVEALGARGGAGASDTGPSNAGSPGTAGQALISW